MLVRSLHHFTTPLLPIAYCLPWEAGRVGRAEVVSKWSAYALASFNRPRVERAPYSAVLPGLASQEFLAQLQCAQMCGPQRP